MKRSDMERILRAALKAGSSVDVIIERMDQNGQSWDPEQEPLSGGDPLRERFYETDWSVSAHLSTRRL